MSVTDSWYDDEPEDHDKFEQQCEDRWIEQQIEDAEQEMQELIADLSPVQKKVYAVLSDGKQMTTEHIFILKCILSGYRYEFRNVCTCKNKGESK